MFLLSAESSLRRNVDQAPTPGRAIRFAHLLERGDSHAVNSRGLVRRIVCAGCGVGQTAKPVSDAPTSGQATASSRDSWRSRVALRCCRASASICSRCASRISGSTSGPVHAYVRARVRVLVFFAHTLGLSAATILSHKHRAVVFRFNLALTAMAKPETHQPTAH